MAGEAPARVAPSLAPESPGAAQRAEAALAPQQLSMLGCFCLLCVFFFLETPRRLSRNSLGGAPCPALRAGPCRYADRPLVLVPRRRALRAPSARRSLRGLRRCSARSALRPYGPASLRSWRLGARGEAPCSLGALLRRRPSSARRRVPSCPRPLLRRGAPLRCAAPATASALRASCSRPRFPTLADRPRPLPPLVLPSCAT